MVVKGRRFSGSWIHVSSTGETNSLVTVGISRVALRKGLQCPWRNLVLLITLRPCQNHRYCHALTAHVGHIPSATRISVNWGWGVEWQVSAGCKRRVTFPPLHPTAGSIGQLAVHMLFPKEEEGWGGECLPWPPGFTSPDKFLWAYCFW